MVLVETIIFLFNMRMANKYKTDGKELYSAFISTFPADFVLLSLTTQYYAKWNTIG